MFIKRNGVTPLEFDGLTIVDYTAGRGIGCSIAEITVPLGVSHKISWSKRSDKYYYVVDGAVDVTIGGERSELSAGDVCIVQKGVRFTYANRGPVVAKLVLVHSPSFELDYEVFEEC